MIDELEQSTDAGLHLHGRLARLELRLWSDPLHAADEVATTTEEAIRWFDDAGDHRGLALAWQLRAQLAWLRSRAGETLAAIDESLRHAARGESIELRGVRDVLRFGPLHWGPLTSSEMSAYLDAVPERVRLALEAQIAHKEGRFDDALEATDRVIEQVSEWGLPVMVIPAKTARAEILDDQGRLDLSLATWEEAVAGLRAAGHISFLSTVLCQKALTHYHLGQLDEAERLAVEGEELGAEEDVVNFAWGRGVRARVAADRGDRGAAEGLARSALEYAYRTDFPRVHGEAHDALGYVLAAAGRTDEARAEYQRTLEIWERYDWVHRGGLVRELLVEL